MTADFRDALSSDIEDYNAFVSAEAGLSPELPTGVTWHAVASTDTVAARDNAPAGLYPVFNTLGERITLETNLYSTERNITVEVWDQYGYGLGSFPFTGSNTDGSAASAFQLAPWSDPIDATLGGGAEVLLGDTNALYWLTAHLTAPFEPNSLLALSTPIPFVPEPSSMSMIAVAMLVIGVSQVFRRPRSRKSIAVLLLAAVAAVLPRSAEPPPSRFHRA